MRINSHGDISSYDQFLCPFDFNSSHFRKRTTEDGRLVVVTLSFHWTCFMPLPFIEVSLRKNRDTFRQFLIKKIKYPHGRSDDADVLLAASGPLVQYGERPVGKHEFSILFLPTGRQFYDWQMMCCWVIECTLRAPPSYESHPPPAVISATVWNPSPLRRALGCRRAPRGLV